jgi:hypothetical protein
MFAKVLPLLERAVKWFLSSFDNSTTGSSARKWTAFVGVLLCLRITDRNVTPQNVGEVLVIWLTFIGALLGLVTYEQIVRAKQGKTDPNSPQT